MKDDTPTHPGTAGTLTARLTASLGPLEADEQACCTKVDELGQKVREMQEQIADAEENLRIIKVAKVDAIRALMIDDPLLAEAFGPPAPAVEAESAKPAADAAEKNGEGKSGAEAEAAPAAETGGDGNPLLRMKD